MVRSPTSKWTRRLLRCRCFQFSPVLFSKIRHPRVEYFDTDLFNLIYASKKRCSLRGCVQWYLLLRPLHEFSLFPDRLVVSLFSLSVFFYRYHLRIVSSCGFVEHHTIVSDLRIFSVFSRLLIVTPLSFPASFYLFDRVSVILINEQSRMSSRKEKKKM